MIYSSLEKSRIEEVLLTLPSCFSEDVGWLWPIQHKIDRKLLWLLAILMRFDSSLPTNQQTNMKIGILTLPLHTNYGGILQAYALQTVLERMGHEVCLIEKKRKPLRLPMWKAPLVYGKRVLKNLAGHPYPIFYEQKVNREEPITRQNTDLFIKRYIKRRIVNDFSELKESDFDAIVVGSDQIWRPRYFLNIGHAYLDFTEGWDIRRMAYAASFGTDEWEYTREETEECASLLKMFDAVSVRERSGIDLCKKHFNIDAVQALDPTLLLAREDYLKLVEGTDVKRHNGGLMCYFLDETPEKTNLANQLAEKQCFELFSVNNPNADRMSLHFEKRIQEPVEQWIAGFSDASFVVTDSFHGCVFSIIFKKPFVAIGNKSRGMSRFVSLLNLFGLSERLIFSAEEFAEKSDKLLAPIDYGRVYSEYSRLRQQSMDFIKSI